MTLITLLFSQPFNTIITQDVTTKLQSRDADNPPIWGIFAAGSGNDFLYTILVRSGQLLSLTAKRLLIFDFNPGFDPLYLSLFKSRFSEYAVT